MNAFPLASLLILLPVLLLTGCGGGSPVERHTVEVTVENIDAVLEGTEPVLFDFWAPWCAPCQAIAPELETLAEKYDGQVVVAKVDIEAQEALADRFDIEGVPWLKFVKGGETVADLTGLDVVSARTGEVDTALIEKTIIDHLLN